MCTLNRHAHLQLCSSPCRTIVRVAFQDKNRLRTYLRPIRARLTTLRIPRTVQRRNHLQFGSLRNNRIYRRQRRETSRQR